MPGCRGRRADVNDGARRSRPSVDAIVEEHGALHVLVNNAGITRDKLAMRMKDEDWDAVLDTNLKAVFRLCRAVIAADDEAALRPHHQHHFGGRRRGNAGPGELRGGQGRRRGHDAALARELGSRGITVNCVAPGFIETDMTQGLSEAQHKALLAQIPLGRLGKPGDIAACGGFSGVAACRLHHRARAARQRRHVHELMGFRSCRHLSARQLPDALAVASSRRRRSRRIAGYSCNTLLEES